MTLTVFHEKFMSDLEITEFKRRLGELTDQAQSRVLVRLAFELTIHIRAYYGDVEQIGQLRIMNELLHKVLGYTDSLLAGESSRLPTETLGQIVTDTLNKCHATGCLKRAVAKASL